MSVVHVNDRPLPRLLMNDTSLMGDMDEQLDPEAVARLNYVFPGIRMLALTLTAVAAMATIYCTIWFYTHRNARIVKSHQPEFLIVICVGLLLWEVSVIPLSFDDRMVSNRGCDIACLSYQWLYSIGFTITFAGLYSKLWRINKIFHNPQFQRISVTVWDVLKPFAVLFTYTFTLMLVWTIVDPPRWTRVEVYADYTFGSCQSKDIGDGFESLIFLGNLVATILTIRQAYKARNVSSDFSETWPLALGLLNWIQLSIIGIPVQAMIAYVVPSASYFLTVSILLAQSLTILFAIFCPLYLHPSIRRPAPTLGANIHVTGMEHRRQNAVAVTGVTCDSTLQGEEYPNHTAIIEHLSTLNSPIKAKSMDNDHIRSAAVLLKGKLPQETNIHTPSEPAAETSVSLNSCDIQQIGDHMIDC
jgi:7 transmembrane sweet-taste receptor of 3 GCPR